MRLAIDVNWDGNLDGIDYHALTDAISEELYGVAGEFAGREWEVKSVGITPYKQIKP